MTAGQVSIHIIPYNPAAYKLAFMNSSGALQLALEISRGFLQREELTGFLPCGQDRCFVQKYR